MPGNFIASLESAAGTRLDQAQYQEDFAASLWLADGADAWKLERLQDYAECGFPSWEAFMAGDWSGALRLYEAERPNILAFQRELRQHRSAFYRVRVVAEPITPYVQWELHCLRVRAECGERIRIIPDAAVAPLESGGILPELVSLCGRVLYHTLYDEQHKPAGAIRYDDHRLIGGYEEFARRLYAAGEDAASCFRRRKVADLPPPGPQPAYFCT
jgi:hypothetical protein